MSLLGSVTVWNRETIESLIPRFGGKTIVVMGHDILGVGENSLEAQEMLSQEEIDQREGAIICEYIPTKPFPDPNTFPSLLVLFEEGVNYEEGEDNE